jgi:hypothetical protein
MFNNIYIYICFKNKKRCENDTIQSAFDLFSTVLRGNVTPIHKPPPKPLSQRRYAGAAHALTCTARLLVLTLYLARDSALLLLHVSSLAIT